MASHDATAKKEPNPPYGTAVLTADDLAAKLKHELALAVDVPEEDVEVIATAFATAIFAFLTENTQREIWEV